jgi:hypothetical protein
METVAQAQQTSSGDELVTRAGKDRGVTSVYPDDEQGRNITFFDISAFEGKWPRGFRKLRIKLKDKK